MDQHSALLGMREWLKDENHWCKHWAAVNAFGRPVSPNDPTVSRTCMLGALARTTNTRSEGWYEETYHLLGITGGEMFGRAPSITQLNDRLEHSDIVMWLDRALAVCEKEMAGDDHEVLLAAREWLKDPEHWTKMYMALNRSGSPVSVTSKSVARTCALGALGKANGRVDRLEFGLSFLFQACEQLYQTRSIWDVNDRNKTVHEDIVMLFDRAIVLCEKDLHADHPE